jgi:hypothetical protein
MLDLVKKIWMMRKQEILDKKALSRIQKRLRIKKAKLCGELVFLQQLPTLDTLSKEEKNEFNTHLLFDTENAKTKLKKLTGELEDSFKPTQLSLELKTLTDKCCVFIDKSNIALIEQLLHFDNEIEKCKDEIYYNSTQAFNCSVADIRRYRKAIKDELNSIQHVCYDRAKELREELSRLKEEERIISKKYCDRIEILNMVLCDLYKDRSIASDMVFYHGMRWNADMDGFFMPISVIWNATFQVFENCP